MGIADRIVHKDGNQTVGDIPIHEFTSAMTLYALGEATHNQIVSIFSLQPDEETGLTALENALDAEVGVSNKVLWISKLEAAGIFYQNGTINTATYKSIMGI